MVEISFRIEGELAILEFVPGGLDPESVQDRVEQLLPLLKHLLDADVAFDAEPEASLERRVSGIAAQGMKVDAAISATVQEVALLTEIITGRASIADHGFPEFDDD